jgi:hypothetical protein
VRQNLFLSTFVIRYSAVEGKIGRLDDLSLSKCIADIQKRHLATGGFAEQADGSYRTDSTAWAVLALRAFGYPLARLETAMAYLAADQSEDGRVCLAEEPTAFWPTPLAVLAWQGSKQHQDAQNQALQFLLGASGTHGEKKEDSPVAHDPSIRGWAWIEDTHSWIDPTVMALLALEVTGYRDHPRFEEGIRMIMDRQLRQGGWNYGNTMVYGQELRPFPDTTGLALTALAGHVEREAVESSIQYLKHRVGQYRTPLSLGWGLFGLGAWGEFPDKGRTWIAETLDRQTKFGAYGTTLLSLLSVAFTQEGDIRKGLVQ